MLQRTVRHHAQGNADADVVQEVLAAGCLVAVDVALATSLRCASTRSVHGARPKLSMPPSPPARQRSPLA